MTFVLLKNIAIPFRNICVFLILLQIAARFEQTACLAQAFPRESLRKEEEEAVGGVFTLVPAP